MKIRQMGTAAAERVPAIFCHCETCENARTVRGREIRTQTQALINDELLIDFPGDTYLHTLEHPFPLSDIEALLVTHWHSDHFYGEDLAYRMGYYSNGLTGCLDVYSTHTVRGMYERALMLEQMVDETKLKFHEVKHGDRFRVLDKYDVLTLDARHGFNFGDCVIYAISHGEKSLLYAHDTGFISDKTWAALAESGLCFDYVSLDCTFGNTDIESEVHMNFSENLQVRERMEEMGLVKPDTIFVANHFTHNIPCTYESMCEVAEPEGFVIAYDGMEIEF
ncbi:MBL fold metallo-hydrolase [Actinomyces minihominis]|uniref:MBL fold metallo-hydrolase n=1 Tax=Actinomyces minihominis TaxID=2002838 RepID=UPI000C076A97|nr:MBL fold metallo-hydrolase [Actinomyces minihominis]